MLGAAGTITRCMPQSSAMQIGLGRPGASERHQRVVADVLAALRDGLRHLRRHERGRDPERRLGRLYRPVRAGDPELVGDPFEGDCPAASRSSFMRPPRKWSPSISPANR